MSRLSVFVFAYIILISTWFLSWLTVGDVTWWLVLINRIVPYLFAPIPVFLILGIYSRRYKLLAALLVPSLIFLWLYHPYLFPRTSPSTEGGSQLTVMTYNVLFSNLDYDAVANVVLVYSPDLVALQEVRVELMDALKNRLVDKYPYSVIGTENEYGTTAIFSKHPFSDTYVLDLHTDRPATIAWTRIGGQEMVFVSLHLLAYNLWWTKLADIPEVVVQRTASQNRQVEALLDGLASENGTVIIGCDCNSYETSNSYRHLIGFMDNAARGVGWLLNRDNIPGVKQDLALQHIDYVWYRGGLEPVRVYKVDDRGGSDHEPVLAIFKIP